MTHAHNTIAGWGLLIGSSFVLAACATAQPEAEIVEVSPPPIEQSCYPIASLEKVVIPAETTTGYYITSIESPSEFYTDPETGETIEVKSPPIESRVPYERVIKEEEIYYTTSAGEIITDICELGGAADAPAVDTPEIESGPALPETP